LDRARLVGDVGGEGGVRHRYHGEAEWGAREMEKRERERGERREIG
jgi:hypothetical protein